MKYMHLKTVYDFSKVRDDTLLTLLNALEANIEASAFLEMKVTKTTQAKYEAVVAELNKRRL